MLSSTVAMKKTVYIETTVISYLTARPSRDLIVAGHQQITRDWWESALPKLHGYISPFVQDEISGGDTEAVKLRVQVSKKLSVLEITPEVWTLADIYFRGLDIPAKARTDSLHLAVATVHGMDYIVSWNCSHIANGRTISRIDEINRVHGIGTPVICTPEELMEA